MSSDWVIVDDDSNGVVAIEDSPVKLSISLTSHISNTSPTSPTSPISPISPILPPLPPSPPSPTAPPPTQPDMLIKSEVSDVSDVSINDDESIHESINGDYNNNNVEDADVDDDADDADDEDADDEGNNGDYVEESCSPLPVKTMHITDFLSTAFTDAELEAHITRFTLQFDSMINDHIRSIGRLDNKGVCFSIPDAIVRPVINEYLQCRHRTAFTDKELLKHLFDHIRFINRNLNIHLTLNHLPSGCIMNIEVFSKRC